MSHLIINIYIFFDKLWMVEIQLLWDEGSTIGFMAYVLYSYAAQTDVLASWHMWVQTYGPSISTGPDGSSSPTVDIPHKLPDFFTDVLLSPDEFKWAKVTLQSATWNFMTHIHFSSNYQHNAPPWLLKFSPWKKNSHNTFWSLRKSYRNRTNML